MSPIQVYGLERDIEPLLRRQLQGIADALIVGQEAEDSRDESLIRTMPAVCLRKRPVQVNFRFHRPFPKYLPRHQSQPNGSRRMRTRRPDHHRPYDIKNAMHSIHIPQNKQKPSPSREGLLFYPSYFSNP